MARKEKQWSQEFIDYANFIIQHPNYRGLPIKTDKKGGFTWIAPKTTEIGKERIEWALKKAKELGIPNEPGVYAKVMLAIHPTKKKACQVCGKYMSLYYIYPNSNFIKAIDKKFGITFSECDSIRDIADTLIEQFGEPEVYKFLSQKFKLTTTNNDIDELIKEGEEKCRAGESKCLGPGAMSNFPDRYDGFHSYNRCCRSTEDKGRSKENLKTYTKDRRAYEYWSDGNIQAANKFMGSSFFKGISADHIGPISLGFIHDSRFLRPMSSGDNSAKRDRLLLSDIDEIISVEKVNEINAMSWYSSKIWEYIKNHYKDNQSKIETYRLGLKTNMANFMKALYIIASNSEFGENFLFTSFLEHNLEDFKYDYSFDENGNILTRTPRNITDATRKEQDRYKRIAIESIYDFESKENRNVKISITNEETVALKNLALNLSKYNFDNSKKVFIRIISEIENRIISDF